MSLPLPVVCESSPDCCEGSPRFYGQGITFLNAQTGFLLDCPPGLSCDSGFYPTIIIVRKGEIPFTPPPGVSPLRFICCTGEILIRYLPDGFTFAQFAAAAQSIADEAAAKLAQCKADEFNRLHARRPQCVITTAATLPTAFVNEAYSTTLVVSGLTGAVTWSLVAGTLPAGITLSSAGVISGTPTADGAFLFVVRARSASGFCVKQLSLAVEQSCSDIDWCNGPGASPCRVRVKDFNLADWQDVCTGGYFATWDGTFSDAEPIFLNPCFVYVADLPGVIFNPPIGAYLIWDGSEWVFHAQLPPPATGLVAVANGPMTQSSPIGLYMPSGPTCTGPASFEIESYTP